MAYICFGAQVFKYYHHHIYPGLAPSTFQPFILIGGGGGVSVVHKKIWKALHLGLQGDLTTYQDKMQ